jgi:hypothetical protein
MVFGVGAIGARHLDYHQVVRVCTEVFALVDALLPVSPGVVQHQPLALHLPGERAKGD